MMWMLFVYTIETEVTRSYIIIPELAKARLVCDITIGRSTVVTNYT